MRVIRHALALTVVLVACSPTAEAPTTSTSPSPTTSTTTTSSFPITTTGTSPDITLVLDETEALAADRGIGLEVSDGDGVVLGWLDRDHPELDVDGSMAEVIVSYVVADGTPGDVVWNQSLEEPVTTIGQQWRGQDECRVALPDGTTEQVALVWQSGGDTATYVEQLDRTEGVVNVVSPIWWRMSDDGSFVSSTDPGYVEEAHDRNVAIWPAIAGFDADAHHLAFSDPRRRSESAAAISDEAQRIGADGVNVDIEGYRADDSGDFLSWVEELTALVHEWGGVVSHDLIPRSDTWDVGPEELAFWSAAPKRTELSTTTDCTVLMAYDEHNRYRPAGPVASPPWVEDVLVHALRYTDPGKLVLGVPFYGRVWDPEELESPRAVGIGDLEGLVGNGQVSFDDTHGLDRVDLADGRFFWAETTAGLDHRFDLMAEYGLAGWAAWRMGFDNPEIWELVGNH